MSLFQCWQHIIFKDWRSSETGTFMELHVQKRNTNTNQTNKHTYNIHLCVCVCIYTCTSMVICWLFTAKTNLVWPWKPQYRVPSTGLYTSSSFHYIIFCYYFHSFPVLLLFCRVYTQHPGLGNPGLTDICSVFVNPCVWVLSLAHHNSSCLACRTHLMKM